MSSLLCCQALQPCRPQRQDHEAEFKRFMEWAIHHPSEPSGSFRSDSNLEYAVQLVKQASSGVQESIRYFVPENGHPIFLEITETDFLEANFEKIKSCVSHHVSWFSPVLITKFLCF